MRVCSPHFGWQPICGLANDFYTSHHCAPKHLVCPNVIEANSRSVLPKERDFLKDVEEPVSRRF